MNCITCGMKVSGSNVLCDQCHTAKMIANSLNLPKGWASAITGAQREKLFAPNYDLVPFQEITDSYIRVAEFGAKKYAPWNWTKGLPRVQLLCSLLRHTFAYLRGEERDSESGLLHTDHIIWNAAAICHSVHWNLEDGRRSEPHRDYKSGSPVLDDVGDATPAEDGKDR